MLLAIVMICSVAVAPRAQDCTRDNATTVMRLPAQFANAATCLAQAQTLVAQTSIGRELRDRDRVKITCLQAR
jgi:hypothetical protein